MASKSDSEEYGLHEQDEVFSLPNDGPKRSPKGRGPSIGHPSLARSNGHSEDDDNASTGTSSNEENSARPNKRLKTVPSNTAYAVLGTKKRVITKILGHWDGKSPDKPRVLPDSTKPKSQYRVYVSSIGNFNASGGYLDRQKRHHQEFDEPIGTTINGIRHDSKLFGHKAMYRWFFVQWENVENPDLANWDHWTRYDTMYDCAKLISDYYSGEPVDYTENYEKMISGEGKVDRRKQKFAST